MGTLGIVCYLYLGLVSPVPPELAQDLRVLQPGTRVRLASGAVAKPTVIEGTLREVGPDSLTIRTSDRQVAVPIATITAAWRMTRPSQKKKGALIGLAAGLTAAAAFALAVTDEDSVIADSWAVSFASFSLLFAPVGAGVGAIVAPGDRWTAVPLSAPDADRYPSGHGVRVSYSIRF